MATAAAPVKPKARRSHGGQLTMRATRAELAAIRAAAQERNLPATALVRSLLREAGVRVEP